jgi:predicted anti-sigma-YlaC factor YlaD
MRILMRELTENSACAEYETLLEDHLTGSLGGSDAQKLSEHLKSCEGCRAALSHVAGTIPLLRVAEPTPDPGPGFARLVMARIRTERDDRELKLWQQLIPFAMRFAATAALVFVGLITYDLSSRTQVPTQVAQVRSTEVRDLFPDPGMAPENRDEVLMMVAEQNHGKR